MLLMFCVSTVAAAKAKTSLRGGVEERLGLVIYTAAIGNSYQEIAKDWCRSVSANVIDPLPFKALALILTDTEEKLGCTTHLAPVHFDENESDAVRSLRIKSLKMTLLPYDAKVYMWLDVDIRPVSEHAPWLRHLLTEIVLSQDSDSPFLPEKAIALTRTRRDVKYNGGLFLYADHFCVDIWKEELLSGTASTTGRDQPALYQITTRTSSPKCSVVDLPTKTQGYFTTWDAVKAALGRHSDVYDHALMHFTGNFHSTDFWLRYFK